MMTTVKRIYIDLQKQDGQGRVILSCVGTRRDLSVNGIELKEGLHLTFYTDDANETGRSAPIVVEGVVHHDRASNQWVAAIDWNSLKHASELNN